MKFSLRSVGLLLSIAILSSCDNPPTAPATLSEAEAEAKLRANTWQWVGYVTDSGIYKSDIREFNHFVIVADTMEGVSGCNGFWAQCEVKGSTMKSDWIISRLLGCPGTPAFASSLWGISTYTITGSQLVIAPPSSAEWRLLVFKATD